MIAGCISACKHLCNWDALHEPFGEFRVQTAGDTTQLQTLSMNSESAYDILHWGNLGQDAMNWISQHRQALQAQPALNYAEYFKDTQLEPPGDPNEYMMYGTVRATIFKLVNLIAQRLGIPGLVTSATGQ